MNISTDHEAIVLRGVRGLPLELTDRYWLHVADAMRTLRRDEMNEKSLKRIVNIAVNRCYSEAAQ